MVRKVRREERVTEIGVSACGEVARPSAEHGPVVGIPVLCGGILTRPAAALDISNGMVQLDLEERHQINGARLMACNLATTN